MYTVIGNRAEALMIDSVVDEKLCQELQEREIEKLVIILTHEHDDHIIGVNYWRKHFYATVISSEITAEFIKDPRQNMSRYSKIMMAAMKVDKTASTDFLDANYSCEADRTFSGQMELNVADHRLKLIEVGGHSKGSLIIEMDDEVVFSGDNLIPGIPTITYLLHGDKEDYEKHVKSYFQERKALGKNMIIFPGHGDSDLLEKILLTHPDY